MKLGIRNKKPKDESIHNKVPEQNGECPTTQLSRTVNDVNKNGFNEKPPTDIGIQDIIENKEIVEKIPSSRVENKIPDDNEPLLWYDDKKKLDNKNKSSIFQLPPKLQSKKPDSKPRKEPPTNYGIIKNKKEKKDTISNRPLPKHIQSKVPEMDVIKKYPANYGLIENKKENKDSSNKTLPGTVTSKYPDTFPTNKGVTPDKKDLKEINNKSLSKKIKNKHPTPLIPTNHGFNENKKENKDNSNKLLPKTIITKHPGLFPTNNGALLDKKDHNVIHNKILPQKIKNKRPDRELPPSYNIFKNKNKKESNKSLSKSISSKRPKTYPTKNGFTPSKDKKRNIISRNIPRTIKSKKPDKRLSPPTFFGNSIPKTKIYEKKPKN